MNLNSYLNSKPRGEMTRLAAAINEKLSNLSSMRHGKKTVPPYKCRRIVEATNGEVAVGDTGQYNAILADQFADGMRKLVNAMEQSIAVKALAGASTAYGTSGQVPFGTAGDLSDFAGVAQLLDESGAPVGDRQLVLNSAAMANLRGKQSVLFKVNEAGTADMLRNGMTDRVQNFALRYSGGIRQHVAGGGSSYVLNGAAAAGLKGLALKTGTSNSATSAQNPALMPT